MTSSSYILRFSPLILPAAATCSALAGLAWRVGAWPSIDNLIFIMFAVGVSGIASVCLLIGLIFLVVDLLISHRFGPYLLGAAAIVFLMILTGGYLYGQQLDF